MAKFASMREFPAQSCSKNVNFRRDSLFFDTESDNKNTDEFGNLPSLTLIVMGNDFNRKIYFSLLTIRGLLFALCFWATVYCFLNPTGILSKYHPMDLHFVAVFMYHSGYFSVELLLNTWVTYGFTRGAKDDEKAQTKFLGYLSLLFIVAYSIAKVLLTWLCASLSDVAVPILSNDRTNTTGPVLLEIYKNVCNIDVSSNDIIISSHINFRWPAYIFCIFLWWSLFLEAACSLSISTY